MHLSNATILFLLDEFGVGGIEEYIRAFSKELKKHGVHSHSLCFAHETEDVRQHLISSPKSANSRNAFFPLLNCFHMNRLLFDKTQGKNTLIIINTARAAFSLLPCLLLRRCINKNIRIIYQFHGFLSDEWLSSLGRSNLQNMSIRETLKYQYFLLCEFAVKILSEKTFAFSEYAKKLLISKSYSNNIHIIHPGSTISTLTQSKNELRRRLKIDRNERVLLFVGRLDKRKGYVEFLRVCSLVQEKLDVIAHICSNFAESPEDTQIFFKKLHDLGIKKYVIHHMLDRTSLSKLYGAADIFLQTSTSLETFGFTTLEALTCEIPVLCFDIGANSEIVRNSENGVVIQQKNVREMAKVAIQMLQSRRKSTVIREEKNVTKLTTKYSWNNFYNNFSNTVITAFPDFFDTK